MVQARISDRPVALSALFFLLVLCSTVHAVTGQGDGAAQAGGVKEYRIQLFVPEEESIHSTGINDATNGKNGEVFFATTFGLSSYRNGTWDTRHINHENVSRGLLDDFVTAVEYDAAGNFWIGYPGGLQVYDGTTYRTITDQQVLKSRRIKAIQRWGDTIWIATGNAGIHRVRNGKWTWFQPFTPGGPGFYEIESMALDPSENSLLITTQKEGIWEIASAEDPVRFRQVEPPADTEDIWIARQDPLGGVYVFDENTIRKYAGRQWIPVCDTGDLAAYPVKINDIAAAQNGILYIATDTGIYLWQEGTVLRHLARFEGIGTSGIVKKLFADAKNRIWFATQDDIGYYLPTERTPPVAILIVNQSSDVTTVATTVPPPVMTEITGTATPAPVTETRKEPSLLERLISLYTELRSRFEKG